MYQKKYILLVCALGANALATGSREPLRCQGPEYLLQEGLKHNLPSIVQKALELGADPNTMLEGQTVFNAYLSRPNLNTDIVSYLLEHGARLSADSDHIVDEKNRGDTVRTALKRMFIKHRRCRRDQDPESLLVSYHTRPKPMNPQFDAEHPEKHFDPCKSVTNSSI